MKLLFLLLPLVAVCAEPRVPAFPGAEGAGMWTSGGRRGTVYRVTNLDAKGPGSLADAVSRPDRFVVFTVSGTIDMGGKNLSIAQPNITIAGQTAPGEGITLRNGGVNVTAGNVIIRHIRVRRGVIRKGNTGDGFGIKGPFENVIVDHVSASWATDENLTLTNSNNVTCQYAINAEGLDYYNPPQTPQRHAFGSLFGSAFDDGRMTIHHSLYAHNRLRNARTTAGGRVPPVLEFRNNVVYDSKEATSHTGSQVVHCNWVANYFKDGPSTGIEDLPEEVRQTIFAFHSAGPHRIYLDGNYVFGSPERTADNWKAVAWGRKGKALVKMDEVRADRPFPAPPVTTQTALEAFETVLAEAGATLPSRDQVDLRVVRDVREGTGAVINTEADIPDPGRWQTYHSLPAPADSDGDGLPDYWEAQFDVSDPMADSDGDGYTNIEEYANSTDPKGGTLPVVYVSASDSRAWRAGGHAGEFRVWRGGTAGDLKVEYKLGGKPGAVVIPSGARYAAVAIPPTPKDGLVVLSLAPGAAYHVGCPQSALVAVAEGPGPRPVRIQDIDPQGNATPEDRAWAERVNKQHTVDKREKIERRTKKSGKS